MTKKIHIIDAIMLRYKTKAKRLKTKTHSAN